MRAMRSSGVGVAEIFVNHRTTLLCKVETPAFLAARARRGEHCRQPFGKEFRRPLAGFPGRAERLGVLRTYCTRHGAGPMPTGGREWDALSADDHNKTGAWQEDFRSGPFDAVLARYALDVVGGCDGLAFTHLDKLVTRPRIEVCWGYRHEGRVIKELQRKIPNDLVAQEALGNVLKTAEPMLSDSIISTPEGSTCYALMLGEALETPVVITSSGKTAESKSEVRTGDAGRAA